MIAELDRAVPERVLVFGTPPPRGRDLDLLARAPALEALERALAEAGFERRGASWARFRDCSAEGVEVVPAESWPLPAEALAAVLERGIPLDGCERLVRPSPRDALIVEAVLARGRLSGKARRRVDAALAEDPAAWEAARAEAGAWGLAEPLAALERAYHAPPPKDARAAARALRRARRSTVIALSGLDGAGKSTQAQALADALGRVGADVEVVWSPLGQSPVLNLVGRPAKRLLALLRFGPFREFAERSRSGSVMTARQEGQTSGGGAVKQLWATFVALVGAAEQRAAAVRAAADGRVAVFDRQALDAIVRMRFLYGDSRALPLQRALIRLVAPTPRHAYYLEIRPETSLARKDDRWNLDALRRHAELYAEEAARLGVRVVDGERPRDEICAEIAHDVWRGLRA